MAEAHTSPVPPAAPDAGLRAAVFPSAGNPLAIAAADLRPWRDLERDATTCTRCELHTGRTKVVFGEGDPDADLLIVGHAPGRHEDLQGKPFAGGAGNLVTNALAEAGLDREEVYLTTLVKCLPPDRAPTATEVETCLPFLVEQIAAVRPRVIVALGELVTGLLLGHRLPLDRIAGYRLDVFDGVTLIPTFHPNDALRGDPRAVAAIRRDLRTAKAVLDGTLASGKEAMADVRARRARRPDPA